MKYTLNPKDLIQAKTKPVYSNLDSNGLLFLDFGKAAFGTLVIPVTFHQKKIIVHLGEQLNDSGGIERNPAGTIRYKQIEQTIDQSQKIIQLIIPADERNTGPSAIKMPETIGEVFPFRYAEIENATNIIPTDIFQLYVHYPFDDEASSFSCSNKSLNDVWELCKHSIKATTFCGVYVDGDRERIPYEGDAYINQLGHYCVDSEYTMARYTHEYLIQHPTWPTEWNLFTVLIAWEDYLWTGETQSLEAFYDDLYLKTLIDLAREDGLISTDSELCSKEFEKKLYMHSPDSIFKNGLKDLVDWPPGSFTEGGIGERDNHEMLPVNTVVNAFHYRALILMAQISSVLSKTKEENYLIHQANLLKSTFNQLLLDKEKGIYIDGEGSSHSSLHSNMFALAFDLVPTEYREKVAGFVKSRGMACSVYGAQFLLEALYLNGEDHYALELMVAEDDRSWLNMIKAGSTITLEAWDIKYKNNLDWNHAWGAAPANIIPRFLMGLRPLEAAFKKILIQPQVGSLENGKIKFPTLKGAVIVQFEKVSDTFILDVRLPNDMSARVGIPIFDLDNNEVLVNGKPLQGEVVESSIFFDEIKPGKHRFERKIK